MNDHVGDELERSLRDVLAHQADSVAEYDTLAVPAVEMADLTQLASHRVSRVKMLGGTGAVMTAAAIALVLYALGGPNTPPPTPDPGSEVLGALAQTTNAGNFAVTYEIEEAATATPPTTAPTCGEIVAQYTRDTEQRQQEYELGATETAKTVPVESGSTGVLGPDGTRLDSLAQVPDSCSAATPIAGAKVTGSGIINVEPLAAATESTSDRFAHVTVYANAGEVWLEPTGAPAQYMTLSAFASTVEAFLGYREAPVAMLGLASPTGYLTLTRDQAGGARALGTSEVSGMAITEYEVDLSPEQMRSVPGTSTEQAQTINAAIDSLLAQGYTGTTMRIGIGEDGYIHSATSTAKFEDGGSVRLTASFSKFGCAGTVTLPSGETSGNSATCDDQQTAETTVPATEPTGAP
ncbi:MAG: hypothetical protein ACT4OX_00980 [Actinomycetota bacterium]